MTSKTPSSLAQTSLAGKALAGQALAKASKGRRQRRRRSGALTTAQRHALLQIELNGGEVHELRYGDQARWVAVDAYGGEIERYDARTIKALTSRGDLAVKRFAFGGAVYGLTRGDARAASFTGDAGRRAPETSRYASARRQAAEAAALCRPSFAAAR